MGMGWLVVVILAAVLLGILAVSGHLLLTWMERRGWIYYRSADRPRPPTLGLLEEIYQPSIEHVVDEMTSEAIEADQAVSGDPEEPGKQHGDT